MASDRTESAPPRANQSPAERAAAGKAARSAVPRSSHGGADHAGLLEQRVDRHVGSREQRTGV
jgi:hypothetical protein